MFTLQRCAFAAAVFMAVGVGLGAFGAHGLRGRLSEYGATIYEKAVLYHFVHGGAMFVTCLLAGAHIISLPAAKRVSLIFALGIVLFSGSLYLLAVSRVRWLGAITPFGGAAFILGWALLAFEALRGPGINLPGGS